MASLMHGIPTPETSITAAKPQTSTLLRKTKAGTGIATGLRLEMPGVAEADGRALCEVITHGCNSQCAMGAGIAKAIKQASPRSLRRGQGDGEV